MELLFSHHSAVGSIGPSWLTDFNVTIVSSEELMHHGTWRLFELKFIKKQSDINEDQQTSVWTETSDFMITSSSFAGQSDSDPLLSDVVFVFSTAVQMSPVYVPLNDYMIHTMNSSVQTFNIFHLQSSAAAAISLDLWLNQSRPKPSGGPEQNLIWGPSHHRRVTCAWQLLTQMSHYTVTL